MTTWRGFGSGPLSGLLGSLGGLLGTKPPVNPKDPIEVEEAIRLRAEKEAALFHEAREAAIRTGYVTSVATGTCRVPTPPPIKYITPTATLVSFCRALARSWAERHKKDPNLAEIEADRFAGMLIPHTTVEGNLKALEKHLSLVFPDTQEAPKEPEDSWVNYIRRR